MKILVTGGAGFIGSHMVDRLIKEGHKVVVVDNLSTGNKKILNKKAKFYKADITSKALGTIFKKEKPQAVFHFAAHTEARVSAKNPMPDAALNILGSLNVLEQCRDHKVKKIIFASTGGEVYGEAAQLPSHETHVPLPISPYGIAKFAVEKYLSFYHKVHGLGFVALRFGNVYGPRQNPNGEAGVVAIFSKKIAKNQPLPLHGSGLQTKDYIYVGDAVEAAWLAFKKNKTGIFNVGTEKETSVIEIIKGIEKAFGKKAKILKMGFPSIGFKRGCLSIAKAKKELGFIPKVTIKKGLETTANWFKNNTY